MQIANSNVTYCKQLSFTGHSKKYPHLPFALDGIGIDHLQEHVDRPSGLDSWQWIQVVNGSGKLLVYDKTYTLEKDYGMLLPPGTPHVYYSTTLEWHVNFLCFGGALVKEFMKLQGFTMAGVYYLSDPHKISSYEHNIFQLCLTDSNNRVYEISKVLYCLLMDLTKDMKLSLSSQAIPQNKKIHAAICYMQENYGSSIGLDDIAKCVGLSKEYLAQIFKKNTNATLLKYLTQIRLAEAKMALLKYPDKTIVEISRMCGFDSPSYFCSVFKRHERMTPLQFSQSR